MHMRFIAKVTSNVLMSLLVIVGLILIGLKYFFVPMTILTGSMVPTYMPGDVVYVKSVDGAQPGNISIGDVVTYQPESGTAKFITHRVIALATGDDGKITSVTTQGDANNVADDPLQPIQIRGVVKFYIPKIGYVWQWVQQQPWQAGAAGLATVAVVWGLSRFGDGGPEDEDDNDGDNTDILIDEAAADAAETHVPAAENAGPDKDVTA